MNKNYTNNNFQGAIDDNRCTDYYRNAKKIKADTIEEMIDGLIQLLEIEEIDGVQFSNDYWSKVFLQNDEDEYVGGIKLILNKEDSLYSESNICKTLELMGSLILSKDERTKEKIKVYNSRELFIRELEEHNTIKHILENSPEGKHAMESHECTMVMINDMNYKLEKRLIKLTDKDLAKLDEVYGTQYPQVHDYYVGYITMKEKYKELLAKPYRTEEDKTKHRLMSKNIKSLKEDFIDCINKKARPIVFKAPLKDEGYPSWDEFDPLDKQHIKFALQVKKGNDLQDDISVIIQDLNRTIDECEFTKAQWRVLHLWREEKNQEDIANTLKLDKKTIAQHLNAIVDKIYKKNLEKYSDWYYLNINKGEYKQCNECGEIKLIQYFDKNGKYGYKPKCKQCRK